MIIQRADVVRALLRALRNRNFLVLAGLSGTGKTQLARRVARAVTTLDLFYGPGSGIDQLHAELDAAMEGTPSRRFKAVEGHDGWVAVLDPPPELVDTDGPATHKRRVGFLPVRPDWTDARKIWGYYNPLSGQFHATDAIVLALNAYRDFCDRRDKANRHFLVLDEMNLAPVEQYLSDLLSLMESGCKLDPKDGDVVHLGESARVHPLDSMIVSQGRRGVVHDSVTERDGAQEQIVPLIDLTERRWVYEPLVEGRSFVRRLGGPDEDADDTDIIPAMFPIPPRIVYTPNLTLIGTINVDETTHGFAPKVLDRAFVLEFDEVDYAAALSGHAGWDHGRHLLRDLHDALEPHGRHFGYRVAAEMLDYMHAAGGLDAEVGDFLMMGKVLPKFRGTEPELGGVIDALLHLAAERNYARAEKRLQRMRDELDRAGFTSFFR